VLFRNNVDDDKSCIRKAKKVIRAGSALIPDSVLKAQTEVAGVSLSYGDMSGSACLQRGLLSLLPVAPFHFIKSPCIDCLALFHSSSHLVLVVETTICPTLNPRPNTLPFVSKPELTFLDSDSGGSPPSQQQTSHQSQAQVPQRNATYHSLQVLDIPTGVPLREFGLANPRSDFATRRRNHEVEMHPDLLFDDLFSGEGKNRGA